MQEMQDMWVKSLSWEDPLESEMATQSNILAWKILWTEELVGYSPWGHKESDMTEAIQQQQQQENQLKID